MLLIKGRDLELLEIKSLIRTGDSTENYWDANWLHAEIYIETASFKAHYATFLRAEDFQVFQQQVVCMKNHTAKTMEFLTMEGGFSLLGTLQTNGVIICTGKAVDETGNCLEYRFSIDNIVLDYLDDQPSGILKKYPVIGWP